MLNNTAVSEVGLLEQNYYQVSFLVSVCQSVCAKTDKLLMRKWHNLLGLCGMGSHRSDLHVRLMCNSSIWKYLCIKKLLVNADRQPNNPRHNTLSKLYYTASQKNCEALIDFQNSFTARPCTKFATK